MPRKHRVRNYSESTQRGPPKPEGPLFLAQARRKLRMGNSLIGRAIRLVGRADAKLPQPDTARISNASATGRTSYGVRCYARVRGPKARLPPWTHKQSA